MDAHDLYGLPLERFVPERGALAKALRSEGKRDEAARVGKLPKPSRAAWAVNQLVRTQRRAVAALFEAGDALGRAQADVIAGRGEAGALREAAERERAAVRQLAEAARGLLSSDGHGLTGATLDRVSETLHAAALDEQARSQVESGCLERELRHVGLGAGATLSAPAPAAPGRSPRTARASRAKPAPDEAAERAARERAKAETERADRERAERLAAARRTHAEARRSAARTARRLAAAQERRDRAAAALDEAEEALAAARNEAGLAAQAERSAQDEVERLGP